MTFNKGWTIQAPGRVDDTDPWTTVVIREAPASTGPYAQIDSKPWPDSTPSTPDTVQIETSLATLPVGWYQFDFVAQSGVISRSAPVYDNGEWFATWAPTPDDIARLVPDFTRGRLLSPEQGAEQFEFTANTDPSLATVEHFIVAAVEQIIGRTGAPWQRISERSVLARRAAAWYVVLLICRKTGSGRLADEDGALQTATREYLGNMTELQDQLNRVRPAVI